jgi:hypothetical protein
MLPCARGGDLAEILVENAMGGALVSVSRLDARRVSSM